MPGGFKPVAISAAGQAYARRHFQAQRARLLASGEWRPTGPVKRRGSARFTSRRNGYEVEVDATRMVNRLENGIETLAGAERILGDAAVEAERLIRAASPRGKTGRMKGGFFAFVRADDSRRIGSLFFRRAARSVVAGVSNSVTVARRAGRTRYPFIVEFFHSSPHRGFAERAARPVAESLENRLRVHFRRIR